MATGRIIQIAGGATHSLVLLDDGTIKCWGDNTHKQRTDQDFSGIGRRAVQIAAGGYSSFALLDDGTVKSWGFYKEDKSYLAEGRKIIQIACGSSHLLALLDDRTVRGTYWPAFSGSVSHPPDDRNANQNFLGEGRRITQITCGARHSLAILDDGTARGWGDNGHGQAPRYLSFLLPIPISIKEKDDSNTIRISLSPYNKKYLKYKQKYIALKAQSNLV